MGRLTKRVCGIVIATEFIMDFVLSMGESDRKKFVKMMEKLADYEDAEEEGRLVVLPCKVGDTVFAELSYDGGCSEIDTGKVFAIGIDERGTMWVSVRFESGLKYHYPSDNIGKDVFLTRTEAEAELKKGENHETD